MNNQNYDTLSGAVNALTSDGYKESFITTDDSIQSSNSKKKYKPEDLKIVKSYRFDGMTNPSDETELFALEAIDGSKGTLVMSYSAEHNYNTELIKRIPEA